jgi:two-component system sensor histidine kinase ChvG
MSLRTSLLLLSLLTLGLPWAGCQYAREMERALRVGQEAALLTTATSLANVIAEDPGTLYRDPAMRTSFDPLRGDLFAPRLPTRPLLDAFADEWPAMREGDRTDSGAALKAGIVSRTLYLYGEFDDASVVASAGSTLRQESAHHLVLLTRDATGFERAWVMPVDGGGPVTARPATIGAPWRAEDRTETRIAATARPTPTGFAIELRLPLSMAGERLALFVVDARGRVIAGSERLGWLHTASTSLDRQLERLAGPRMRLSVVDVHGWLLARSGSLAPELDAHLKEVRREQGLRQQLYRRLLARPEQPAPPYRVPISIVGEPVESALAGRAGAVWLAASHGDPSIVRAAVPLRSGSTQLGAFIVEQPADRVLILRDAALARLLDVTLGLGLAGTLAVIVFAAWLGHRLRRLSRAAGTALTPEGRLAPDLPERGARDELGELARSFDALLQRLEEQNAYLRSLASKLSHELRTPLTIVSSSLDNLGATLTDADRRLYLERAQEGTARLQRILNAMSEATRIEQSIDETERVKFDLARVVRDVAAAYQASFGTDRIATNVMGQPACLDGSPDLIAQLLDKLIENAIDFCPPEGTIEIGLEQAAASRVLYVRNEGPPLPAALDGRIFDSMTTARTGPSDRPHLGLGLHVAKLIAAFHGARISARNLEDRSGVLVTVEWSLGG